MPTTHNAIELNSRKSAFWLVMVGFFVLGIMSGTWQVALPELKTALNLSNGELGFAISVGVIGSLPAMFFAGRLADRWGARYMMTLCCLLCALTYSVFYWVHSYSVLLVGLFIVSAATGAMDVAINAAAVNYEQNTTDHKMNFFHAGYSGMGSFSAMLAGYLLFAGLSFRELYLLIVGLLFLLTGLFWYVKSTDAIIGQAKLADSNLEQHTSISKFALLKTPVILFLALIIVLCFFAEGTLESWSAVYLRLSLNLSTLVGAAGPAIFHFAMMTGRLSSGWVLRYLRRRVVLKLSGLLAAIGVLLAVLTTNPVLILIGLLLAGLALSAVVPIVYSLAGSITPRQAGEVISVITITGYFGFMVGPSIIGGIAEMISLRLAIASLIFTGLGILGLTFAIKHPAIDHKHN